MKRINKRATGIKLGLSDGYVGVMEKQNPEVYKELSSQGIPFEEAFKKAVEEIDDLRLQIEEIYYELLEDRNICKFGDYLCEHGLYKTSRSFSVYWGGHFATKKKISWAMRSKWKQWLKLYPQFKIELDEKCNAI